MLKLVRLYDVKIIGNKVTSAKAEIICDLDEDFDEDEVMELRNELGCKKSEYFVIWNVENSEDCELATCEYVLFDDLIGDADWDYRVYSAVAVNDLGMDFRV